jgi:hypothetical protein
MRCLFFGVAVGFKNLGLGDLLKHSTLLKTLMHSFGLTTEIPCFGYWFPYCHQLLAFTHTFHVHIQRMIYSQAQLSGISFIFC